MQKKKGLGRDVQKSVEIMDEVTSALKKFSDMPLKRGLMSNKIAEKDLVKAVNDASEKAYALRNMVEDLKSMVSGTKAKTDSRFASKVVARFIESQAD